MAFGTDLGTALPFDLGRGLARVQSIRSLFNNTAERAFGVLRVAANVVDDETVTIGSDVFEVDIINSNPTAGAATLVGAMADGTADVKVVFNVAHGLSKHGLFKIGTEIFKVTGVASTTQVGASRARCGTSHAAHLDGDTILVSDDPAEAHGPTGHIPVGLVTTLTPTAFLSALQAEINADAGTDGHANSVRAIKIGNNTLLVVADSRGAIALATTETLSGSGNAWDAATMSGGVATGRRRLFPFTRTPIAAEATAGELYIPHDLTNADRFVVQVTTAGAVKAWDGVATLVAPTGGNPGYLKLDNSGATDWTPSDTIQGVISEG